MTNRQLALDFLSRFLGVTVADVDALEAMLDMAGECEEAAPTWAMLALPEDHDARVEWACDEPTVRVVTT